jgi:hypothetical protein
VKRKRTDKMTTAELFAAGHEDLARELRANLWADIHYRVRRQPYTKVRDIPAKVNRTYRVPARKESPAHE